MTSKDLKIDYISDIHITTYLKSSKLTQNKVDKFIERLNNVGKSDYLFLAGDISEHNTAIIKVLKSLSKHYKKVFFLLGNHDYYIHTKQSELTYKIDSLFKVEKLLTAVKEIENVEYIDKKVFYLEGKKIGADTLWYYPVNDKDKQFYLNIMPDVNYIMHPEIEDVGLHLHKQSVEFYNSLEDDFDLFVSHAGIVNPPSDINPYPQNSNFQFMTDKIVAKQYIFGHSHLNGSFEKAGVLFHTNCLGYPSETMSTGIETITI